MTQHNAGVGVADLVREVLMTIPEPWLEDITDQICLAIENTQRWLSRYNELVRQHGKQAVNSQIGRSALQASNFKNLGVTAKAKSNLIQTYTKLG